MITQTWKPVLPQMMDKQTVVHPDDGILFSGKKHGAIKLQRDMEGAWMHTQ